MDKNYIPPWVFDGPVDLEYRRYKMLAEVERLKSNLLERKLDQTLNTIDSTLSFLYRYDAERIIGAEDKSNYELTGINFSKFSLEYTQKSLKLDHIMDMLCEEAIDLFEDLYALVREDWLAIEDGITISYVPSKKILLNDGFVFIITPDNKLHLYYFTKPTKYIAEWNLFKLEYISTCEYNKENYFKHLDEVKFEETDKILLRIECKNSDKIEGHAITVIKSMLYTRLKKDYLF